MSVIQAGGTYRGCVTGATTHGVRHGARGAANGIYNEFKTSMSLSHNTAGLKKLAIYLKKVMTRTE